MKFGRAPNTQAIWGLLDTTILAREFRTGDLGINSWNAQKSHTDRLNLAVDFLYF